MREKGASMMDKGAHRLMEYYKGKNGNEVVGFTRVGQYIAFYHEERLYSVFDTEKKICHLLYARSPYDAIETVMGVC